MGIKVDEDIATKRKDVYYMTTHDLPQWDLTDLYQNQEAAKADLSVLIDRARGFNESYRGQLDRLTSDAFLMAIREYEEISTTSARLYYYAELPKSADVNNVAVSQFCQFMIEQLTESVQSQTVFFALELAHLTDDQINVHLQHVDVARYHPFLKNVRKYAPHMLSEEMTRFQTDLSLTGAQAWEKFQEELLASLRVSMADEEYSLTEILNIASYAKTSDKRVEAGRALAHVLDQNALALTSIFNNILKAKEINDKWEKMPNLMTARNLSNNVSADVVDALVSAVVARYADVPHRFYALKARLMGQDKIHYWDRNCVLPELDTEKNYTWDQAKEIVLNAYRGFSSRLADVALPFFDNPWIDVGERPGKRGGAFATIGPVDVHPYLFLNFSGRSRDVSTLAHELGHGVHAVLSAHLGALMADPPLTICETASVFGEHLLLNYQMHHETDARVKFALLMTKIEDSIATVMRQIAFHVFEVAVHTERRTGGELSTQRLNELYIQTQRDMLGSAIVVDDSVGPLWGYITHFIASPFYVHAYAFGECLVSALYDTYMHGDIPDFQDKYIDMLCQGGTKGHAELFAPFGLDTTSRDFWNRGLNLLSGLIDQAESLAKELGLLKG